MIRPLDRDSPTPLWAQLVGDLRHRAEAGEFATGFPSEPVLTIEYGVSRHTVREALRRLRATGAVVSQRGRGSTLVPTAFTQPAGALYSLFTSIEATGVEQRSEVRQLALTTDPAAAVRLDLPPQTPLVVLRRRRLAAGEPLAVDTAWLPASLAHPLLEADFTRTGLYQELAGRCGLRVDGGWEEIVPVVPDQPTRDQLGLPDGVAAFQVHRRTTADGHPVEWRSTTIRGDRYHFTASWSPTHPYRSALTADQPSPSR